MRIAIISGWRTLFIAISAFALLLSKADGANIASFNFDSSLHKATHIVLVSEGDEIDGKLQVIESWKGDLHPGDTIEVPELAQFASKESRTVEDWNGAPTSIVVSGNRMILFLVKSLDWAGPGTDEVKTKWLPASFPDFVPTGVGKGWPRDDFGRTQISVMWIENGKSYAYRQVFNPGPLLLTNGDSSNVEALRKQVEDWLEAQESLSAINSLPDPADRVKQAIALAIKEPKYMRDAVEIVAGSGPSALPGLRHMYKDPAFEPVRDTLVHDIGDLGGAASGPELTEFLKAELAFWRKTAPDLEKGWWNGFDKNPEKRKMLRERYDVAVEILRALTNLGYSACKSEVEEFRDYWESLPQMEELKQLSETCDEVIKSFTAHAKTSEKHVWGFEFAAGEPDPTRRAKVLEPFLGIGDYRTREKEFNALAECGVAALPCLRTIVNNTNATCDDRIMALRNLAKAGGIRAGSDITQFVSNETAYLSKNDLVKTATRWNDLSPEARCHYGTLQEAVEQLEPIGYAGAVNEVSAVLVHIKGHASRGFIDWQPLMDSCQSYLSKYAAPSIRSAK